LPSPGNITIHITNWLSTYDWGRDFDRIYVLSDTIKISRNNLSSAADPFLFHMFQGTPDLTFDVGQAGAYTISVHSGAIKDWGNASAQNYTMSVTATYCNDVYEPNETIEGATPISIGATITAFQWRKINNVQIWGDEDWYKITINSPGKLKIEMVDWIGVYNWGADFDRLFVYNANGVSIGSKSGNDFYGWMMGGGTDIAPVVTEMNLTHAGTYYLRYHAGGGTSTTPYHFTTSFTPANDQFEPNDSLPDAKLIPLSETWYQAYAWRSSDSTMNVLGDEDYYYFNATAAGQYSLTLEGWIGIFNWGADYDRLFIYNSKGEKVGASPLSWMMGKNPINFNVPSEGKYYIRLHCGSGFSLDGYKFKLSGATVDIEDADKPNRTFQFYPNPASDMVTLTMVNRNHTNLTLNTYNAIGELISSEMIQHNQQQINVAGLSNGMYVVEIKSTDWSGKQKLIIQR